MSKNNKEKLFANGKKLRYKSYSSVAIIVVVAIALIMNMLVDTFVDKFGFKFDLTPNNVFAISDKTKEVLNGVNKEVNIYFLTDSGMSFGQYFPEEITNILDNMSVFTDNYTRENSNIKYKEIYINSTPTFAEKYMTKGDKLYPGSIIVECGDKYKVLDTNTYFTQSSQSKQVYMGLEQLVTSAISYVLSGENYALAFTKGHSESGDTTEQLKKTASVENYDSFDVNLATEDIPENVQTLIIVNPTMDFSDGELAKLDRFFEGGKSAMLFMDVSDVKLPNLTSYLAEWGITVENDYVIETDSKKFSSTPNNIIPTIDDHDITTSFKDSTFYMANSRSITVTSVPSVTTDVLFETSDKAYSKADLHSGVITKEPADKIGKFVLGTISKKQIYINKDIATPKLLVCGSADAAYQAGQEGANKEFIVNSLNWMSNKEGSVSIPAKAISSTPTLELTQSQSDLIRNVTLFIVPLITVLIGLFVWLRRKQA